MALYQISSLKWIIIGKLGQNTKSLKSPQKYPQISKKSLKSLHIKKKKWNPWKSGKISVLIPDNL